MSSINDSFFNSFNGLPSELHTRDMNPSFNTKTIHFGSPFGPMQGVSTIQSWSSNSANAGPEIGEANLHKFLELEPFPDDWDI